MSRSAHACLRQLLLLRTLISQFDQIILRHVRGNHQQRVRGQSTAIVGSVGRQLALHLLAFRTGSRGDRTDGNVAAAVRPC